MNVKVVSKLIIRLAGNSSFMTSRVRIRLLNLAGAHISASAVVSSRFNVTTPRLTIGDNVYINEGVSINTGYEGNAEVKIGGRVQIGPGTMIICVSHIIGDGSQRAGQRVHHSVYIGEGAWIGANVTVLPGVKIGRGCVIGAGAVVTKDTCENCLYVGVPAKLVRCLE